MTRYTVVKKDKISDIIKIIHVCVAVKIWDHAWHIQMVFVGHTGSVTALDIYPHGSAIISASLDSSIRVWNLDTCDEVDR